jgi:hypothetical protein
MCDLVVELASGEWVPWCPQDNRGSARSQQQTKSFSDEATPYLDLIQRARYVLRVLPLPASEMPPAGEALFAHGLLTLAMAPCAGGCVERVCVMNVSDRLVRVHHGMRLLEGSPPPPSQPTSPPRPGSDTDDGTP